MRGKSRVSLSLGWCLLLAASLRATPALGWRQDAGFPQYWNGLLVLDGAGDVIAAQRDAGGVVKLAASDGGEVWRVSLSAEIRSLAVDSAGDVVVAGESPSPFDFTVIKLSGSNGSQLWRRDFDGTQTVPDDDAANDVTVDAAGDVIATGYVINQLTNADALVIKLAGATGAELWRHEEDETSGHQFGYRVVADASSDVIASTSFGLIKYDGTLGTELWRTSVGLSTLTLDAGGDVVGANFTAVEKIDGGTGAQLWFTNLSMPFDMEDVAIDAAGDVIAVGNGPYPNDDQVWGVFKLDGGTGAELWHNTDVKGRIPGYGDNAIAVAVDGAGDAVVAGYIANAPYSAFFWLVAAKFSGSSGAELWRQAAVNGFGNAVAIDAGGNPIVGGVLDYNHFTVLALNPLDGAIGPVAGFQLIVRDNAGNANGRMIFAQSKDKSLNAPVPGTVRDPSVAGGELELLNPTTLESAVFTLPAASWIKLGTAAKPKGYRYLDPSGVNGPCRLVLLKRGTLRVLCQGYLGPIPFSLDEPSQGSLTLSLRLGSGEGQCVTFGGTVIADAGTSNPGPGGIFKAKESPPASGRCP